VREAGDVENSESVRMTFDLSGRVAVVTGAGGGIGRATAEVLSGAGATVYCVDVVEDAALETAAGIVDAGGTAVGRSVDVAEAAELTELVDEAVASHGRLDIMCNVAGIMVDGSVLDVTESDLDRVIAVNLKGVLFGCQAAGRVMVEQRSGSIVNMASTAAYVPAPEIAAYSMTKAAVLQLTRVMATEVGRRGVRVNAIAPGFVPTDMTARYYRRPDGSIDHELEELVLAPMRKFAPLGRVGMPSDVAYCVLFLASDASSFLTGQCLSPNGGVAMH
jgi:3-oxoacyl-[acyl-carrier protein] reductase